MVVSNRKRKDRSEGSIAASSSGPVSSFEVGGSNDHQQFEAQRIAALIGETPVLSSFVLFIRWCPSQVPP